MANRAYNCNEACPNKDTKCKNEGFIDSTCKCRCPDHITGEFCETIIKTQRIICLNYEINKNK